MFTSERQRLFVPWLPWQNTVWSVDYLVWQIYDLCKRKECYWVVWNILALLLCFCSFSVPNLPPSFAKTNSRLKPPMGHISSDWVAWLPSGLSALSSCPIDTPISTVQGPQLNRGTLTESGFKKHKNQRLPRCPQSQYSCLLICLGFGMRVVWEASDHEIKRLFQKCERWQSKWCAWLHVEVKMCCDFSHSPYSLNSLNVNVNQWWNDNENWQGKKAQLWNTSPLCLSFKLF